jgi:hypothetical protein
LVSLAITAFFGIKFLIHRHIGGLENAPIFDIVYDSIHRHIGGLESDFTFYDNRRQIHRHIGGLENI